MKHRFTSHGCTFLALGALLVACAGGQPPPRAADTPPPLDDEPAEAAAPASSESVQEGIDALTARDFETAKAVLTKAHADNPEDAQAAYYLGVALEGTGDSDGAVVHYKKALELDPALSEAAVNLSAIALDSGDGAAALEAADAALKKNPTHAGLLTNRGIALLLTGDNAGAAKALRKASAAAPDDASLRYSFAEALAASGDKKGAAAELRKLVAAKDLEVLASAARLLGRLRQWEPCIEASKNALAQKKAPELYVQRGLCHHGHKDEASAKADYEAALEVDGKFAVAHYYLGRHYIGTGDKAKAKASLSRAVEFAPDEGVGKAAAKALKAL